MESDTSDTPHDAPDSNARFLEAGVRWLRLLLEQHVGPPSAPAPRPGTTSAFVAAPLVAPAHQVIAATSGTSLPTPLPNASAEPTPANESRANAPHILRRALNRVWPGGDTQPAPVSAAMPASLLPEAQRPTPLLTPGDTLAQQVAQAQNDFEAARNDANPPALIRLSRLFDLTPFEEKILLLCCALELDTRIGPLCAQVQGDGSRPYPTFALAMALFPDKGWEATAPERPLRYWRLIEVNQPPTTPLMASALRADERILRCCLGLEGGEDRLAVLLHPAETLEGSDIAPTQQAVVEAIGRAWSHSVSLQPPVIHLVGADTATRQQVAALTAGAHGLPLQILKAGELPADAGERDLLARLWQREARILPQALYIEMPPDAPTGDSPATLSPFLRANGGCLFLGASAPLPGLAASAVVQEVNRPTPSEQRDAWADALGGALPDAPALLAGQFDLNLPAIHRIGQEAWLGMGTDPRAPMERVWEACQAAARPQLDALAQRLTPRVTWDDLVLPDAQMQSLHEIADQAAARLTVYEEWGFGERMSRGRGISVLFAGESGVGKTLAAEVLATHLRLPLYRIDLASVVSKYIGETERNLQRIFDEAERGGVILLFDEADAIFGTRTEVKDSHDRYANIEVNYLLQRMEAFRGLAILATNRKSALDTAFLRRLRFVVDFTFPSLADRRQMWQRVFPARTPLESLDYDALARLNLTGAGIHNVALNAAFRAAQAGGKVDMAQLMTAARAEYRKMDRPVNEADFRFVETKVDAAAALPAAVPVEATP